MEFGGYGYVGAVVSHETTYVASRQAEVPVMMLRTASTDPPSGPPTSQRRFRRMITLGNPPETESVSAALVKPALSKSVRVPT